MGNSNYILSNLKKLCIKLIIYVIFKVLMVATKDSLIKEMQQFTYKIKLWNHLTNKIRLRKKSLNGQKIIIVI
jgi:hypothetical protein